MSARHASLFRNGRNQAVRIPREFEFEGTEVLMRKDGDSLILTPRMLTWEGFDAGLSGFSDDFAVTGGVVDDPPRDPLA